MSFSASGWTRRTSTSSPVTFSICEDDVHVRLVVARRRRASRPTVSLASLGKSVRFIFLSGCIAGLPNASLALSTPSRLAPFSRPSRTLLERRQHRAGALDELDGALLELLPAGDGEIDLERDATTFLDLHAATLTDRVARPRQRRPASVNGGGDRRRRSCRTRTCVYLPAGTEAAELALRSMLRLLLLPCSRSLRRRPVATADKSPELRVLGVHDARRARASCSSRSRTRRAARCG